jgi:hypothetical protein
VSGASDRDQARVDQAATERLHTTGDSIVRAVESHLEAWTVAHVRRILDAWGRADAVPRADAERDAHRAGRAVATATADELRALFALDVSEQRVTPLEIVRRAITAPTRVLEAAGVPSIERSSFDERAFPDDRYGLVPQTLGDLGDESLGPLQLAWGMAKAAVLQARSADERR